MPVVLDNHLPLYCYIGQQRQRVVPTELLVLFAIRRRTVAAALYYRLLAVMSVHQWLITCVAMFASLCAPIQSLILHQSHWKRRPRMRVVSNDIQSSLETKLLVERDKCAITLQHTFNPALGSFVFHFPGGWIYEWGAEPICVLYYSGRGRGKLCIRTTGAWSSGD